MAHWPKWSALGVVAEPAGQPAIDETTELYVDHFTKLPIVARRHSFRLPDHLVLYLVVDFKLQYCLHCDRSGKFHQMYIFVISLQFVCAEL